MTIGRPFALFVLCSVTVSCLSSVRAATVTLHSERDTTLYANNGSRSNGGGAVVFAGTSSAGSPRRGLLWFDVAGSIPAGSTIDNAQLTLHVAGIAGTGGEGGSDPATFLTTLHALAGDWGEGTAGAGTGATGSGQGFATPADGTSATWTHAFYDTQAWFTPGADFVVTPSASALVSGTIDVAFTWGSTASLIADVQGWLDNPATNFGWILIGDESTTQTFRNFYSREASDEALRPVLSVIYTPIPEPSTLVLLVLGAIGFVIWWRFDRRRAAL